MIRRTWSRLILVIGMSLAVPLSSPAQTQEPARVSNPPVPTRPLVMREAQGEGIGRAPMVSAVPQVVASPAVTVGQSGLSFRYVQTFGVTDQAYPADTNHLYLPTGLFIDSSDNVYIAENRGSRVLRYDSAGNNTLALGTAGLCYTTDYVFCAPNDLVADNQGNVWVADGNRVVEYSASGVFSQTIPANTSGDSGNDNTHFNSIPGIAYLNGRLFVADQNNQRVQVYYVATGTPVYSTTIGVTGVAGGDNLHFNNPWGLSLDSSGRLYVVDNGNNRVQRCTYNSTWNCSPLDTGLNNPRGITVDSANNVYIADSANGRIVKCASGGGCNDLINGIDGWANDVAVDSSGNVYLALWAKDIVAEYDSSGNELGVYKGVPYEPYVPDNQRLNQPRGVAVATDGSIFVGEDNGNRLVKMSPDGTHQWAYGIAGVWGSDTTHLGAWWAGVQGNPAIDSAGRIIVADTGNGRIQIFNPTGSLFSTFGSGGSGPYQFACPTGVALNPLNGDIVIADVCNQRVQIFTSKYIYKATLGVTGTIGSNSTHFNYPRGVAVDSTGAIYVADSENYRVQKCTLSGSGESCSTFAGVTGMQGSDLGHFSHPMRVAVDSVNRVYVADEWNNRVQVFDLNGAYLTTIGGNWGANSGELRGPEGIAVDGAGNVYVADSGNHRVQKYAPGVPGWQQVNVNGFGDKNNELVTALAPFAGQLYAGMDNESGSGAQLWRSANGVAWTPVMTNGFGITLNMSVKTLYSFQGQFYAGTSDSKTKSGGELWRSLDGLNWTRVISRGFGDPTNGEVFHLIEFGSQLYASVWSYTRTHGAEIWRSTSGNTNDWTRVVTNGFGNANNMVIHSLEVFSGSLYAGTYGYNFWGPPYTSSGGEVWRTSDGLTWVKVSASGFGDLNNYAFSALAAYKGFLYVGAMNMNADNQIWRCQLCDGSDWQKVIDHGLGQSSTEALFVANSWLYYTLADYVNGLKVFRTSNGVDWESAALNGFGNSNNVQIHWDHPAGIFNDRLYLGTWNWRNGTQIWKKTVTADFSVDRTMIKPGATVTFTNTSAGDVITSTWKFGDGGTLTGQLPQVVTHTYTSPGEYTVTLTVTDGIDTNTVTRTNYIQVGYRAYMPVALGNSGTLSMTLYDNFNDNVFDGLYNPLKWYFDGSNQYFSAYQTGGGLVITNTSNTPGNNGLDMLLVQPPGRKLRQVQEFEARLKISSGNVNSAKIQIMADSINGHQWWTQCSLQEWSNSFVCGIAIASNGVITSEYGTGDTPITINTWYTVRIEINPVTAEMRYYLNGALAGSHVPNDATALLTATNLVPRVGTWNGVASVTGIRYIDDVKITPAGQ